MPALPSVSEVLRIQLRHSNGTDTDVLDRLYWSYSGTAPSASGLNTMCSTLAGNWATTMAPLAATTVALTEIVITDLSTDTSPQGTWSGTHAGTRSGASNSAATSVLGNFAIARRYRGGKPRIYLPYLSDTDITNPQQWFAASITALNTAWTTFMGDIVSALPSGTTNEGQVNVSYYNGFTAVENPITHRYRNVPTLRETPVQDAIVSTSFSLRLASQRRRLGKSA